MSEIKVSKVYSLGEQPSKNFEGTIWADTTNESAPILKRADSSGVFRDFTIPHLDSGKIIIPTGPGTSTTLNERLSVIGNALLEIDSNVAAKANDADVIKVTGGTITDGSLVINDTYVYEEHCSSNLGLQVTGKYHDLNTGEYVDVSTNINPAVITGDAVTSSIIPTSEKLLTSGGAYTALQTKVNKGALYFNGGYAQCPKLLKKQQFSFAVRIKANKNDVLIKKQVNIIDMGVFYLYIHPSVQRLSVYATGTGNSLQSVTTEQNNRIFDGNWHSLFVTYDGTTLTLSDEFGVLLTVNYSIQEQTSGTIFGSNFVGQMQDICVFNFDMSADDAPYTIADYKNGKAIPPKAFYGQDSFVGGIEQSYSWLRTGLTMTSNITFDENGTNFIFDNTNGTSAEYQVAVFNVNIPKGANVSIEGDWAGIYAVYLYYGSVTPIQLIDNGEIIKNHVTNTENCTALRIRPLSTGAGSTRTITLPPSCKIKVNGAILALEDYTFNGEVLDYSGNNNHATITGNVIGDNDNSILIQTEEILKDTATLSQLETKADKTELNNKQDTLLYYSEDEMGATLSAFDIDLAAGERAELSTSYGNELILRDSRGITLNISDDELATINGSAIATTIDSSVGKAHNKLPTAKAVYNAIKNKANKSDLTNKQDKLYNITEHFIGELSYIYLNAENISGTAIVNTVNSNSTDNKLPTAKAVYDAIKDINITPVNTLDLVLTSSSNKVYAVTPKIENNIPVLTIELQEGNTSTYKPCYILGEDGSSIYLLEVDGDKGSETFIVSNVSNSVSNINTNGIGLLIKGSDGINYNLVPAGEVGYEYYTLSCVKDSTPVVSINLDNGDAIINENTVYSLIIDSDTNFVLPEQKAGSFAQILVCAKITSDVNIDFGTTHFFNDEIPTIETNNNYDILFEHDPIENVWVCGTIKKG